MKQTNTPQIQSKISPEQQIESMLMCGDNRSFCHVKAKRNEERICVPQHSFSLCISAGSFCSHRQTLNALGKPGTPVLEHLGQNGVCSQRNPCNISPQMEMDLDFVTFSTLRQKMLSTHLWPVFDDRGERHSSPLALQSFLEAGHILGIICIYQQTK